MSDSRHCPECGANIGVWAVLKAPLPNRIYCPACGQRLVHSPLTGLVVAAVAMSLLLGAGCAYVAYELWDDGAATALVAAAGALVAGGAVLEVAFVTILWYGDYELKPVGKPRPPEDADPGSW